MIDKIICKKLKDKTDRTNRSRKWIIALFPEMPQHQLQ